MTFYLWVSLELLEEALGFSPASDFLQRLSLANVVALEEGPEW